MKNTIKCILLGLSALTPCGCADYLDVVPDKTEDISLLYSRKEAAYRALATCYHYMPLYEGTYGILGSSDELIMDLDRVTPGKQVVLGNLTSDYPVLGYWNDDVGGWDALGAGGSSMFKPLRICNDFLDNIKNVPDMTQTEITRWSSEVKFLKAYYHYLLFTQYGAIPLIRKNESIGATGDALMPARVPVGEVVDYIVSLIDEAVPGLPVRVTNTSELGRIDQVIAKSFKAKVLLFAASPLFNNNPTYASFTDKEGTQMIPSGDAQSENAKWVKAAEAFGEAITSAEAEGVKLYEYKKTVPAFDADNYASDPRVKYMYNYQYAMADKWNEELIWGCSRVSTDWHEIQRSVNFKSRDESSTGDAWQWMSVTMNAADFFYTENGLPMEEDPDYDYDGRFDIVNIPESYSSVAIPGEQTVAMHLGREPRFYASIGFDRSRVRGYGLLYDLKLRFQERNGRQTEGDTDNSISGYMLRKVVHPDTKGNGTITRYPWPIIRLADLYLGYAEALNEAYGTERRSDILKYVNAVRSRSGVPSVEESWAKAKLHPNLYTTKEGMREIIQRERTIELAFEGQRNDDVRRWLKGTCFNSRINIWNMYGSSAEDFYTRTELTNMRHVFSQRNYLWPIPTDELVNNVNLVQNPGY